MPGINPSRPGRKVLIRTDGAGGSKQLLGFLSSKGVSYSIGFTLPMSTPELYHLIPEAAWQDAYNADGQLARIGRGERPLCAFDRDDHGRVAAYRRQLNPEKLRGDSKMPKITRVATTIVAHT